MATGNSVPGPLLTLTLSFLTLTVSAKLKQGRRKIEKRRTATLRVHGEKFIVIPVD